MKLRPLPARGAYENYEQLTTGIEKEEVQERYLYISTLSIDHIPR